MPPRTTNDAVLTAIERAAARDVGRGSATLASHTAGSLRWAADSLTSAAPVHAVIITGFFIPGARSPAAETDGPIGAVQLAAAIVAIGGSARILTDEPCAPVVRAAIAAASLDVPLDASRDVPLDGPLDVPLDVPFDVPLDVAPLPGDVGWPRYAQWEAELLATYEPVTHMISIERAGPGRDGVARNMRGADISAYTAPLERIYVAGRWTRIAIGDGGNELGMGSLSPEIVGEVVPLGGTVHCAVECAALIIGGTSNWGAAAVVAALAIVGSHRFNAVPRPDALPRLDSLRRLDALLRPGWSEQVLAAIVRAGAVDGVRAVTAMSVDGLDWPNYAKTIEEIERLLHDSRDS